MSRAGSFGARLYRGEVSFDFVGRQRIWYMISLLVLLVAILGLVFRGLNLGVEFTGGSVFQFKAPNATVSQVRSVTEDAGAQQAIVQQISGGRWRVETESLDPDGVNKVQSELAQRFHLGSPDAVSPQVVGPSWGEQVSNKALVGLLVFLGLVVLYLTIAFEWKMAASAIVALLHDLVITAGVYALVGFEVTPATVIGFLTILGYSLYDTVVVFDKVRENTAGLLGGARTTYSQAANLAVNQTLVRSINTSVIALLPVGAILFVGAGLLGAGTLKDLALALFVGIAAGTYSSIFIATPLLADLKEREPAMRALAKRVTARQAGGSTKAKGKAAAKQRAAEEEEEEVVDADIVEDEPLEEGQQPAELAGAPSRRVTQQGPRQQPRRSGSKRRPSGKKRR